MDKTDKVHSEKTQKVLRGGRFVSKEEAANSTSVARMASLFDPSKESRSPVLNRSNLREPSPLVVRKTEKEAAPIITAGSNSSKLPNGSTVRKNKVTITASARQPSPASSRRSPATNKAAFTKVIQVTGSSPRFDELDDRYKKVVGVLGRGSIGSPPSPVKKTSAARPVIKPMGMMGYGRSAYPSNSYQSSYRLASYLNKTSGTPFRSGPLPASPPINRTRSSHNVPVSSVKVPASKPPKGPARKYNDDYSDSSDDDTPDTSEEGDPPAGPLAVTEKHPGGLYFKSVAKTSPPQKGSSSKTQGTSQNAIATQKPVISGVAKSSTHPIAVKQPGGLYFTSKTTERSASPTRLPWERKKDSSDGDSLIVKSTCHSIEPPTQERSVSKSRSTQELSSGSGESVRKADDKHRAEVKGKDGVKNNEGKKKPLITRDSSSSISVKVEREKASSPARKNLSGSYKLPDKLEKEAATLSQRKPSKERPKSFSDMSSLEPQLDKLMSSPLKDSSSKAAKFPPSEPIPKLQVTESEEELSTTKSSSSGVATKQEKGVLHSTPAGSNRKWSSPLPSGRPLTPAPNTVRYGRYGSSSCTQLDSQKPLDFVKGEKPALTNEYPVFTFQMPVLKRTGVDLCSNAAKSHRNNTSRSTSANRNAQVSKVCSPGAGSVSVKSRIALWKTLEKETEKSSLLPPSSTNLRRGSEPILSSSSPTRKQFFKSASVEARAASVSPSSSPKHGQVLKPCTSADSKFQKTPTDSKSGTPGKRVLENSVLSKRVNGDILGDKPSSLKPTTASPLSKLPDPLSPDHQMGSGVLSPGVSGESSGRSSECVMQESDEELEQVSNGRQLKRISSLRSSGFEDSITVEVFDPATRKALQSASSCASTPDLPADDLKLPCVADERLLSPNSVDDSLDEQSLPELSKDTSDMVFEDNPDESGAHAGAAYSYQEYTRMRKSKALSTTSTDSGKPLVLESIPEHDVSEPKISVIESGRSSVDSQREGEKTTSSDSETEFKRKLSGITNTFLDEVLTSLTSAVLANNVDSPSTDSSVVRKTPAQLVAELVEKQPELSEYADNIYETIKEYGHRVSQKKPTEGDDEGEPDEKPPELPPRPKFLSDIIATDNQTTSPTHDSYVLMHSDSVTSSLLSSTSVVADVDDSGAYEPMVYVPQNVTTSKKKSRSPKKGAMKKTSKQKKETERMSFDDDDELEVPDSPKRKNAVHKEESRHGSKKKKKRFFSRLSRDDSSKVSTSHTLQEGVRLTSRIGACVSPESAPTPERAEFGSSDVHRRSIDSSPIPTAYANVKFDPKRRYQSLPFNYRQSPSERVEKIDPTHTSESDSEGSNFPNVVCDSDTMPTDPFSPSKVHWADSTESTVTMTDMEACPELVDKVPLPIAADHQRYTANPLTPPLVTKLTITQFPPKTIRFSSSDPNIHNTLKLLTASKGRRDTIAGSSPSPAPSLNIVDSSVESTFSDGETSSLNQSICSFDSFRGADNMWRSPVPRKRMKSDTISTDFPSSSLGALQKERLLQHRRKGGSLSGAASSESDGVIEVPLVCADALMDRDPMDDDELGFSVNDVIAVLDMTDDDWWQGMLDDRTGWFPASWVRLRIGQESDDTASMSSVQEDAQDRVSTGGPDSVATDPDEDKLAEARDDIGDLVQIENKSHQPERKKTTRRMTIRKKDSGDYPRKLTPTQVRARCVKEILTTERDYVQHLEDIVQGFLKPCTQHPKMFDAERIETVFSNVEDIYHFQRNFLAELESRVVQDKMEDSQIGEVFVQSRHQFALYSEYCNNHPQAVNELNLLQSDSQFALFFESLRLLRNLTDISLDGFLLTPVQKICRYPLQLSELLKYTTEDHPDRPHVLAAQDAMRDVAILINERKRRMENVGMIGFWQETIESWKGPDITDKSTELLHHGEMHKISKGHSQERHFFLFDHQLVYCRKEVVGGKLSYKGRINLDKCLVVDIADGEVIHNGSAIKNAWKVHNVDKGKWYVIFAKTPQAKEEWKKAFEKERQKVREDQEAGFFVTEKMRKAAVSLCSTPHNLPRRKSIPKKHHADWVTESLGSAQTHRLRVDSSGVNVGQKSPTEKKKLRKKK